LLERVAELRDAFDRSFAMPTGNRAEVRRMFLVLAVGAERYAIALDAILGIEKHRKIVPLPLHAPGLMGLAGFRGQLVPVFSLAALLRAAEATEPSPWLVFCKGPTPMALAFDQFAGSERVAGSDIYTTEAKEGLSPLATQTVRIGTMNLPILDIPSVAAAARQRLKND
jgi:purine-binding chemotaxis protein CheW